MRGLVDEVIETAVIKASSRIRIFNKVKPGVVVDADREHLIRVLTNLTRNAIQALEFLQAERRDAPDGAITLEARREGSVTVIEVRDNGPGIPEQVRERLFQAFQSAARQGGTGLGLAIAAELVRAHGGDIQLAKLQRRPEPALSSPFRTRSRSCGPDGMATARFPSRPSPTGKTCVAAGPY